MPTTITKLSILTAPSTLLSLVCTHTRQEGEEREGEGEREGHTHQESTSGPDLLSSGVLHVCCEDSCHCEQESSCLWLP